MGERGGVKRIVDKWGTGSVGKGKGERRVGK